MHSFWGLRQAIFERVSPELRAQHGLELPEVFLLEYIGKSDLSPSEIADSMRLPAHAISRRLDGLEKRKLIRRSIDPGDARRRVLALTHEGQALSQAALATLEAGVGEMLGVLGAARVEAMLGAMERLAFGETALDAPCPSKETL